MESIKADTALRFTPVLLAHHFSKIGHASTRAKHNQNLFAHVRAAVKSFGSIRQCCNAKEKQSSRAKLLTCALGSLDNFAGQREQGLYVLASSNTVTSWCLQSRFQGITPASAQHTLRVCLLTTNHAGAQSGRYLRSGRGKTLDCNALQMRTVHSVSSLRHCAHRPRGFGAR